MTPNTKSTAEDRQTAQIITLPDLDAESDRQEGPADAAPLVRDWSPLHQVRTRLAVCVGEASISVGELLSAEANQVLRLDRTLDQPVDLSIEGQVIARGQLVAVDGHFGVRITELPVTANPAAESRR